MLVSLLVLLLSALALRSSLGLLRLRRLLSLLCLLCFLCLRGLYSLRGFAGLPRFGALLALALARGLRIFVLLILRLILRALLLRPGICSRRGGKAQCQR